MSVDIDGNLRTFGNGKSAGSRSASFDFCFNYFQRARERQEQIFLCQGSRLELSCLHLGFYLASWGMMRGSLHGRSLQAFVPVVVAIAREPAESWELDVSGYLGGGTDAVLALGSRIRAA